MRLLTVLALIAAVLPLAACAGAPTQDPYIKVRSPLWLGADPTLVPQNYAMPVQVAPQYVQVAPQYVAPSCGVPVPAPQAAPAYTQGYEYAAPPVPAPRSSCP